jgi:hypothetical protein
MGSARGEGLPFGFQTREGQMLKFSNLSLSVTAMLALAFVVRAGDDEKIPLDKVPPKVLDAVKAKYPKAKILSAQNGDVDGTKVFEFMLEQGKKQWEVAFTPDAKFHSSEESITELPAKVKEAFDKKFPGAKITKMEKETTGEGEKAKVIYEIFVMRGTDEFEILYDADAKFIVEKKVPPAKK